MGLYVNFGTMLPMLSNVEPKSKHPREYKVCQRGIAREGYTGGLSAGTLTHNFAVALHCRVGLVW